MRVCACDTRLADPAALVRVTAFSSEFRRRIGAVSLTAGSDVTSNVPCEPRIGQPVPPVPVDAARSDRDDCAAGAVYGDGGTARR